MGAQSLTPLVGDPLIGTRIEGRYLVQRVHGHGGTSTVYAGIHEKLRREIAIKVLNEASTSEPDAVARFELEARMGSSLSHAHMVSVSDVGRLPDGRPFLVMLLVPGEDMATLLLQEGPQHPRRVAALLAGVASALDFMHARNLVHRDIKSENLMHVTREDGTETALVLDFGIAARHAAYSDWAGTPEFMAPEALSRGVFGRQSDIYSLATVAFEAMTAALPFDADDLTELTQKKETEEPLMLSEVGEREFPDAIEQVIARALSRNPEQRHATAMEFVREIEAAAAQMSPWLIKRTSWRDPAMFKTLLGVGARAQARATATQRKTLPLAVAVQRQQTLRYPTPATPLQDRLLHERSDRPSSRPPLVPSSRPPPVVSSSRPPPLPPTSKPADAEERVDLMERVDLVERLERLDRLESARSARDPSARTPLQSRFHLHAQAAPAQPNDSHLRQSQFDVAIKREAAQIAADAARAQARRRALRWVTRGAFIVLVLSGALFWGHQRTERLFATLSALAPQTEQHERNWLPAVGERDTDEVAADGLTPHVLPAPSTRLTPALANAKGRPLNAKELADEASEAMKLGDYATAASKYQQAIALDVRYAPAWQGKGLALERLGESRNAAGAFRRFLELAPRDPAAVQIRARLQSLESAR